MTRDEVTADLRELTKLLNDLDYETRQTAHEQLARAGKLATDPLREAAHTGGLVGRERVKSLLRLIGLTVRKSDLLNTQRLRKRLIGAGRRNVTSALISI